MQKSYLRGHPIIFKDGRWVYADTLEPSIDNRRSCGHCGRTSTKDGHDGCMGTLPGIMNACCGHGDTDEAYVQYSQDKCVRGLEAEEEIIRLKNT